MKRLFYPNGKELLRKPVSPKQQSYTHPLPFCVRFTAANEPYICVPSNAVQIPVFRADATPEHLECVEMLTQNRLVQSADCALKHASLLGNHDVVRFLVDRMEWWEYPGDNPHSSTPPPKREVAFGKFMFGSLQRAILNNHASVVGFLLNDSRCSQLATHMKLLVLAAAKYGTECVFATFIVRYMDPAMRNLALHQAVFWKNLPVARVLVGESADPTVALVAGIRPLTIGVEVSSAIRCTNIEMIEYLISAGADMKNDEAGRAVLVAIQRGELECAKLLVSAGADLGGGYGRQTLFHAVVERQTEVAKWLLESGVDVWGGRGIIEYWIGTKGNAHTVQFFVQLGLDVRGAAGGEMLLQAVERLSLETVFALLAAGARVDVQNKELMAMADEVFQKITSAPLRRRGNPRKKYKILEFVRSCGSLKDFTDETRTELKQLCAKIHLLELTLFMEASPFLTSTSLESLEHAQHCKAILLQAAEKGYTPVLNALLVFMSPESHNEALALAAQEGYAAAVESLLNAGADPSWNDSYALRASFCGDPTAALHTLNQRCEDIGPGTLRILISRMRPAQRDRIVSLLLPHLTNAQCGKNTCIVLASAFSPPDVVKHLLSLKADPTAHHNLAFICAVRFGMLENMTVLAGWKRVDTMVRARKVVERYEGYYSSRRILNHVLDLIHTG